MSQPLRIAYIINSLEGGGAALPVPAIADVLRAEGCEVAVFALTGRDRRALPAMLEAGLEVHVREGGETDHLAALAWLDREVRRWRPTHLWTSLSRATLLGQIIGACRRLPVVSWQHNMILKPWNRRLLRWQRNASALWVADSEAVYRHTLATLHVPAERLMTWPIFRADPAASRAAAWRPGEALRIGTLGRLHPAKGYDLLIAAAGRIETDTPLEIMIAGEGAERAALEAAAAALPPGRVRLAGYVEDTSRFLAGLHLYVQPSRREGLCVAAHEAMQAGLPVIASAVGELAHSIAPGETGWLVPPGDVDALAGALATAIAAPEQLAAAGEAAHTRLLCRMGPERFAAAGAAIVARLRRSEGPPPI